MDGLKFLRFSLKKLLITGFVMWFLGVIAFYEGIGYEAIGTNVRIVRVVPHVVDYKIPEAGLGGNLYIGYVNVSLNPFLYPLSYLLGNGKSSCIAKVFDGPILVGKRNEAVDTAKFGAVFPQFLTNLPYFLFVAFLIAQFLEKLHHKVLFPHRPSQRANLNV